MQVVQPPTHADSSDEENDEDEPEEQDIDDSEILENLPSDTEVCAHIMLPSSYDIDLTVNRT